jgi:RHS repeat-associated protein
MTMDSEQPLTSLPTTSPPAQEEKPPNPARDVEQFVSGVMQAASAPVDALNRGVGEATLPILEVLPRFPAARLWVDLVFGWPHFHEHPPNLEPPAPPIFLPSIGPVLLSGAVNVLINGFPAARCEDVGFGAWCGGFFPLFEVGTGSSHVFIGGARAARQLIDFTRHCSTSFSRKKGGKTPPKDGKTPEKDGKTPSKEDAEVPDADTPESSKFGTMMNLMAGGEALGAAGMGALGVAAARTDAENANQQAENADSAAEAAAASAQASAFGVEATMTALQSAADLAAMALSVGMGKDPGFPPLLCLGNILTGSPNVLIGGFPMPGWLPILGGLGKLLHRPARKTLQRMGLNQGCGKLLEPIDVVTGANVDDFIDFTLPAPRFVWRRWYNSHHQQASPLGWGFRHEYQRELRYDEANAQFTYTDQEGNSVPFPSFLTDLPGEQVVQHGYVLTCISERRYELTTHDQPALEFAFRDMTEPALPVALRDAERNFTFEYDAQARLIRIQLDEQRTVRLAYAPAGLLSEVVLEQSGQETIAVARYRHDDDGCLVEFRDALDKVARYEYDSAPWMTRKTDRRGYSYHYRYDEQGRCVYTSGDDRLYEGWLDYHPEDNTTVVEYSDEGTWVYEYNELGTITKIIDPYGGTQHRIVDPDTGLVTRELDPAGNPTQLLYDEHGAPTGRRDPLGYWAPPLDVDPHPPDPLEHKVPETPIEWECGNLLDRNFIGIVSPDDPLLKDFPEVAAESKQSRPSASGRNQQSLPQEKYDLLGQLIERRNVDGSIERWEYDAEGNEISYIDGDGSVHRQEYTSWNLLHREIDPADNPRAFQYSPTEKITQFVDAGGTTHEFCYDKKDRLVEVSRNGIIHDIYRYDEADNLIEKLDGNGRRLLVCDPGFGRLDRIRRFADGEIYQYEYNKRGRITKAQTRRDRVVLDYDEEGRSTSDERNGLGVENDFAYGELISTIIFGKFITRYRRRYDSTLVVTDPTGRIHTFDFSQDGLILKNLANGTKELTQYDAQGRCLRKVVDSADDLQHRKSYRYSAAGDLLQVEDSRRGKVAYHCDAAHRLKVTEHEDGRKELYAYDKAGNLVLQPGLDGVQIGAGNQLKQANGERFCYGHRDNVVLRESDRKTTSYEYDAFDQLVEISLNGREWQADYDALGRRARMRWSGQTTEYYWDHDRLSAEIRGDGSVRVYVYADERALVPFLYVDYASRDAEPESGIVKYVFTNHLGVPERVEDESGRTIWQGAVSPYGAIRVEIGRRDEINLRFPGHYYDVETGLHYNRFRYYDPVLGCYLQCDPLGIAGGYNLYAYLANPLTGVDILGLESCDTARNNGNNSPDSESRTTQTRPPRRRRLHELKGWVAKYGKQQKVTQPKNTSRPVDRDHQPSKAAIKKAAASEINQMVKDRKITKPTAAQMEEINKRIDKEGLSAVVDRDVHKAGPTHGHKNTDDRIAEDAEDLGAATHRDADAMVDNASELDPDNLPAYKDAAKKIKEQTHEEIMDNVRGIITDVMDP